MARLQWLAAGALLVWSFVFSASAAPAPPQEPELIFAGLYINDEEHDGADLYRVGERLWLPLPQLIDWAELQIDRERQPARVSTPLGESTLDPGMLRELPEGTHVALDALADFGVKALFDQNNYALVLYVPWVGQAPAKAALIQPEREPQYHPPRAGLTRIYNRLDSTSSRGHDSTELYSDALGHLANGVWGLQTNTGDERESQLTQLYWSGFNRYNALRLGTAKTSPGPLLEPSDYTGLQFGYSNHSVYNHLASNHSVSRQMFVDDAAYSHDISGTGPKGGIAELRLNDRPIARVRIALDGRFLFRRLPITQGNTDRVEVALFEYSLAQPPVEIINYSTASKPRAVSTGELVFNGGLGREGGSVDASAEGERLSYGSLRYGVTNFLTLEAAAQRVRDQDIGWYLGAIASLNKHIAASVGSARAGERTDLGAEIWGTWPGVKASYKGNRERDDSDDSREQNHDLSVRWDLRDNLSLFARGKHSERDGEVDDNYLAPGLNWKINDNSIFSLQAVGDDDYSARLSLRSERQDASVQLRSSRDAVGVGAQYAFNDALSVAADLALQNSEHVLSAAANYRPRHNNDSVVTAQISHQQSRSGYALSWRQRISPRTQFNFNYQHQLSDEETQLEDLELDDETWLGLTIESELWVSPSGWRLAKQKTDSTHGALSARLLDPQGQPLDLPLARLQIEETKATLRTSADGEQRLTGLEPGDYNLKLLAEGLPIEYESSSESYRVRIAPAATTQVDITLYPSFGVAGLLSLDGEPQAHAWVEIWRDGERLSRHKTDSYGYYQATDLRPGQYELRHAETVQPFVVVDDFLFDIDLAAGVPAAGAPAAGAPTSVDATAAPQALALSGEAAAGVPAAGDPSAGDPAAGAPATGDPAADAPPPIPNAVLALGSRLPNGLGGRVYLNGEPLGHIWVVLQRDGRKVNSVISDSYGYYSFHHLRRGTYQVLVDGMVLDFDVGAERSYGADIHLRRERPRPQPEQLP